MIHYSWNDLPSCFLEVLPPKKAIGIPTEQKDKNIPELLFPFTSGDELRPVMGGIYYGKTEVTATDAHTLAWLPTSDKGPDEIINKDGSKVDGLYPSWKNVVPKEHTGYALVNLEHFKIYVTNCLLFANEFTYQFRVLTPTKDDKTQEMGFNGRFVLKAIEFFEKLGLERVKIFWSEPNRAIVMTTPDNKGRKLITKKAGVLIMPVMLNDDNLQNNSYVGAECWDFKKQLTGIFNLKTGRIDVKGNSFKFKTLPPSKHIEGLRGPEYKALLDMTKNKTSLEVLDYCLVQNKKARVTDLETTLEIPVQWEPGFYKIEKRGPLKITDEYEVDNYPQVPPVNNLHQAINVPGGAFADALTVLKRTQGQDELRPVMMGLMWYKDYFTTTDAYGITLIKAPEPFKPLGMATTSSFNRPYDGVSIGGLNYLVKSKGIFKEHSSISVEVYDDGTTQTKAGKKDRANTTEVPRPEHTIIRAGNITFTIHNIDARVPNIEAILKSDYNFSYQVNPVDWSKIKKEYTRLARANKDKKVTISLGTSKVEFNTRDNYGSYKDADSYTKVSEFEITPKVETVDSSGRTSGVYLMPVNTRKGFEFGLGGDTKKAWFPLKEFSLEKERGTLTISRIEDLKDLPGSGNKNNELALLELEAEAIKIKFKFRTR